MHHDVKLGDGARAGQSARLPLLGSFLSSLVAGGCLVVFDSAGRRSVFGDARSGPTVTVRLHEASLPLRIALSPSRAFGEAYMDGTLTIESGDLRRLLSLVTGNFPAFEGRPFHQIVSWLSMHVRSLSRSNGPRRSRRNVAHHYDLSGTLYDLFLDGDHQYSCAYFVDEAATLEQAQAAKKRHIAAKLLLSPGQRVLDIGCGWGGLAIDLARDYGVDVIGITLSEKQLHSARLRAEQAGLGGRVRFELKDYRSVASSFDRVVSVGMFEHVGVQNYGEFFDKVRDVLAPDGVALLSAIGRMAPPTVPDAWISRYIFPGGYIPSLSETLAAIEPSHLWVTDIEILRVHYAETLKQWFDRFEDHRIEAAALYDERFCRMWEFYLAACEMLFRNGPLMVFHMQLAHRRDAVPLTRDYITDFDHGNRGTARTFAQEKSPAQAEA
jgi:cyclopropane-fatty-acyl-phospholipid synthase